MLLLDSLLSGVYILNSEKYQELRWSGGKSATVKVCLFLDDCAEDNWTVEY